eukprot:TRINITY_DN5061_c0_g1_i1.p1 TRINITY_DN5061_c0_g1~~TRINITY_DN5061_c0_g1_i1.p1  ORF type:complete len:200 (-),score=34.17 TRINITY_DN5061_c0_g1_i1:165-764(-)
MYDEEFLSECDTLSDYPTKPSTPTLPALKSSSCSSCNSSPFDFPIKVIDNLYIGGKKAASNPQVLQRLGITAILNVANEIPCFFVEEFHYLHFKVEDSCRTKIENYFEKSALFIDENMKKGGVLVHCNAGNSRSATIVLHFLMRRRKLNLKRAVQELSSKKSILPNPGFWKQLLSVEAELFGSASVTIDDLEKLTRAFC